MTNVSSIKDILMDPWVLSYDERSISCSLVAKDWAAAIQFFNNVKDIVLAHEQENSRYYPDLQLTGGNEVQVGLSVQGDDWTAVLSMAKAIHDIIVGDCASLLDEPPTLDASSEEPVTFDPSHYKSGLNGDFLLPSAIEKFAGENGIFENEEVRDIAAAKDEIVKALKLFPGAVVADIGAGTALLEPLLSEAVGKEGSILAVELSPIFRSVIEERCNHLGNVHVVHDATDRDPKLPNSGVDLALLVDVYHHLEFPQTVLRNIRAGLKRNGALVVIDFHRDPARIKSHDENWVFQHLRADQATFTTEIERTGFMKVQEVQVPGLPENYFLVFRKRPILLTEPGAGWTSRNSIPVDSQ